LICLNCSGADGNSASRQDEENNINRGVIRHTIMPEDDKVEIK